MTDIGITVETAAARLQLYLAAETKVLNNQSYEMGDRKLTRADLGEIREGIKFWSGQCQALNPAPRVIGRARRGAYRGR